MKKKKNTINKIPKTVYIAAAVCLAALIFLAISFSVADKRVGKFVPPEFDPSAQTGTPDVPEWLGWGEIWQHGMDFKAKVCGVFIVEEGSADVWFTNTSGSAWLRLQVQDESGNVLGQTGIIRPGEFVQSVKLDTVPEDGSTIVFRLMAYEPDTYYSLGAVLLQTTALAGGE